MAVGRGHGEKCAHAHAAHRQQSLAIPSNPQQSQLIPSNPQQSQLIPSNPQQSPAKSRACVTGCVTGGTGRSPNPRHSPLADSAILSAVRLQQFASCSKVRNTHGPRYPCSRGARAPLAHSPPSPPGCAGHPPGRTSSGCTSSAGRHRAQSRCGRATRACMGASSSQPALTASGSPSSRSAAPCTRRAVWCLLNHCKVAWAVALRQNRFKLNVSRRSSRYFWRRELVLVRINTPASSYDALASMPPSCRKRHARALGGKGCSGDIG